MADFDLTKIPELTMERLEARATEVQERGDQAFQLALAAQRALLDSLVPPPRAAVVTAKPNDTKSETAKAKPTTVEPVGEAPTTTAAATPPPAG